MMLRLLALCVFILLMPPAGLRLYAQSDENVVTSVAWSPDGTMIATVGIQSDGERGYLSVTEVATGRLVYQFEPSPGGFSSVVWAPNNQFIAAGGYDQTIWIFNPQTQEHVTSLIGHQATITAIDWSSDGHYLVSSGNWDGLTILWDMTVYQQDRVIEEGSYFPVDVAFSPDDQFIAIGGEGGIRIYSTFASEIEPAWYFQEENIGALAWNQAGTQIAFGTQSFTSITNPNINASAEVYIFDVTNGNLISIVDTRNQSIFGIAWNPDNSQIATYSINGSVIVWADYSFDTVENYIGASGYPQDLSYSAFGGRLAYGITLEPLPEDGIRGLVIVVPDPSIERLQSVANLCVVSSVIESDLMTVLEQVESNTLSINDFIAYVEALPSDALLPGCAADLLAVAEAIQSQQ